MKNKKLTFSEILFLIYSGRSNEIPKGYNIRYIPCEPQEVFDVVVPGNKITISRDDFPKPAKAHITGNYSIYEESPYTIVCENPPIEYGDVFIHTTFNLSKLEFEYDNPDGINEWMDRLYDVRTIPMKKDYVFDSSFVFGPFGEIRVNVNNAMVIGLNENIANLQYDFTYIEM